MRIKISLTLCVICIHLLFVGVSAQENNSNDVPKNKVEQGVASYYGKKFQGKTMANGKKFDYNKLTGAHNRLPLGTFVKVSNLRNKKSVIVEITDRMHRNNKRLIDLSSEAARQLGFLSKGLTKVKVEVVDKEEALNE